MVPFLFEFRTCFILNVVSFDILTLNIPTSKTHLVILLLDRTLPKLSIAYINAPPLLPDIFMFNISILKH